MFLFKYQVESDFQILSLFNSEAEKFSFLILSHEMFEYVISQFHKLKGFQKLSEIGIPIYKASSEVQIIFLSYVTSSLSKESSFFSLSKISHKFSGMFIFNCIFDISLQT
jgi:hypothetical protein